MKSGTRNPNRPRWLSAAAVLLAFAAAAWLLGGRLVGQLDYLRGLNLLREGPPGVAAACLERALQHLPNDPDVHLALGQAYYLISGAHPDLRRGLVFGQKAENSLRAAVSLRPCDAEAVYRLAVATAWLDRLQRYVAPTAPNPYDARPLLEAAISLRPNFISARFDLARLLYRRDVAADLARVARELGAIFPPAYHQLRREPFWSQAVTAAFAEGVRETLARGRQERDANLILGRLAADASRWPEAAERYRAGLSRKSFKNSADDYLTLGGYCLQAGRFDEAAAVFTRALERAENAAPLIESIYQRYRQARSSHYAVGFFQGLAPDAGLGTPAAICLARSYLDLARPALARRALDAALDQRPTAEGYYWRAVTAREERDWDAMEIYAQKATVIDPDNSRHHHLLAAALESQNKLPQAELQAALALKHAAKPDPWLYHHRAWIRWNRQDYAGAARDWQQAVRLSPGKAGFYAHLAEAYGRLGDRKRFEAYYRLALQLDPDNAGYRKRLAEASL